VTDQSLLAWHRDVAQTANLVASIVASALKFDELGLGRLMDTAVALPSCKHALRVFVSCARLCDRAAIVG